MDILILMVSFTVIAGTLYAAYNNNNPVWLIAWLIALITSIYTFVTRFAHA